ALRPAGAPARSLDRRHRRHALRHQGRRGRLPRQRAHQPLQAPPLVRVPRLAGRQHLPARADNLLPHPARLIACGMSRIVSTDKAPPALGPYSQAVKAGNLLYTAGQTGLRPDGEFVGGSVTDQAEQVMDNLEAVLAAAGCTFADVVKATCYLTSMDDFKEFNAVYGSRFGDQPPARTTVAVAALPMGAKVEVELVALLK